MKTRLDKYTRNWIKENKNQLTPNGMIDRDGKFYPLPTACHEVYAKFLNTTKDILWKEKGWIMITTGIMGIYIQIRPKSHPTSEQLYTLHEWCIKHNKLIEYCEILERRLYF